MDFTDAYRLSASKSTPRSFAYSPGSTFFSTLHYIGEAGSTVVQVRVSTSLQVIRSWTLDFEATSSSWSRNGALLLIVGKGEFIVLAVDPNAGRRIARDGAEGVVARVQAGMEGMTSASWVGNGDHEAVCALSNDEVSASIYDINTGALLTVANPKRSRISPSPTRQYLALLTRQNAKDGLIILASPNSRHSQVWSTEVQGVLQTNDAIEVAWSPNEKYLAIREGVVEYKVQIYSLVGHLRSSFQIDSNPALVQSSFISVDNGSTSEHSRISGGGLGIREVKWSPSGHLLALGGYDEVVRILESTEWSAAASLDLSKKVIAENQEEDDMGALMAWREPYDWRSETGGRGIVEYEQMDMPFTLPSLRIDMSSNTSSSKSGICWLDWNHDGTLLAVRNDNHPAAVYIYALPYIDAEEEDQRIQPSLLSVVILSSSITLAAWKPVAADRGNLLNSNLAITTSDGQAVHLWSYRGGHSPIQIVEAIPMTLDDFQAIDFAFAPDGTKILITSSNNTYCCAIEAQGGSVGLQDSHL